MPTQIYFVLQSNSQSIHSNWEIWTTIPSKSIRTYLKILNGQTGELQRRDSLTQSVLSLSLFILFFSCEHGGCFLQKLCLEQNKPEKGFLYIFSHCFWDLKDKKWYLQKQPPGCRNLGFGSLKWLGTIFRVFVK